MLNNDPTKNNIEREVYIYTGYEVTQVRQTDRESQDTDESDDTDPRETNRKEKGDRKTCPFF